MHRLEDKIEARITSKLCGALLKQGKKVMMHWAADPEDNGEWHRPPKEMLPEGTNYRFQKHSVQTAFKLNEDGHGEVVLTCPDSITPKKIRFIAFVSSESVADVWFKNSNEGDFEMYVCPDQWRAEIEERDMKATKRQKSGIFGLFQEPKPIQRAKSDLAEGETQEQGRAQSPPRTEELDGSWRPLHKLQRTKSAEIRHYKKEQREKLAAEAVKRHSDNREHVKLSVSAHLHRSYPIFLSFSCPAWCCSPLRTVRIIILRYRPVIVLEPTENAAVDRHNLTCRLGDQNT